MNFTASEVAHILNWKKEEPLPPPTRKSFVYFMRQSKAGYYNEQYFIKIGHSYNPQQRAYAFRDQQSSSDIIVQIEMPSKEDACSLERHLHRRLLSSRKYIDSREFFDLTEEVLDLLRSLGVKNKEVFK